MKKLLALAFLIVAAHLGLKAVAAEVRYNDAASVVYTTLNGLSHNQVQGFCQDRRGVIWICTWYGLDAFDGYEFHCFRPQEGQSLRGRLKQATLTADDRILLKTSQAQTWQFSLLDYTFSLLPDDSLAVGTAFKRRFTDRAGNLWQKEALGFRLTPPQSDCCRLIDNATHPLARALAEDARHNILIAWSSRTSAGRAEGMVVRYDLNAQPLDTLFRGNAVCAIYEDSRQNLWLGMHDEGLVLLRPRIAEQTRVTYTPMPCRLPAAAPVFALVSDRRGRLWVGTLGEGIYLATFDPQTQQPVFTRPEAYPIDEYGRVRSMVETEGMMLIATDGGLLKASAEADPEQMEFQSIGAPNDRSELIHLLRTTGGDILVSAFGKGIYRYEPRQDTLIPFVATDIAARQAVYSMADNPDGSLWVTTQTSLRLYQADGSYRCPVKLPLDMIETAPLRDSRGCGWFASQQGVLRLTSPLAMPTNVAEVPTFVSIRYNGAKRERIRLLTLVDSLITLQPAERNVTIGVSALHYGEAGHEHYAWRMPESDTAWHVTQSHLISLPRFAPGSYTLQVRCADVADAPCGAVGTLHICVAYRWFEMPLFHVLLSLLAAGLLLTLVVLLLRVKKLQRMVLDSQPVAMLSAAITEIKAEDQLTAADRQFIERLNLWVGAELGSPQLSVDRMAEAMGMSRSSFYRRLKSVVGQSPNEYIGEMRLQRAAELLRADAGASISAVAYECGFSSPQYFSNVFRRRYHMTPNQWRNQ